VALGHGQQWWTAPRSVPGRVSVGRERRELRRPRRRPAGPGRR
jgi:hypothetical protein